MKSSLDSFLGYGVITDIISPWVLCKWMRDVQEYRTSTFNYTLFPAAACWKVLKHEIRLLVRFEDH
jgi:hypothetical protein